jgi:hypothetical protein
MRPIALIIVTILLAFATYGQDSKTIKGIVVDKSGFPIPYCTVSEKGTKNAALTNNCGEFELATAEQEFTIVFNCPTHDFVAFERRVNPQELRSNETIVFRLKGHGKTVNKECKKKVDKRLKKLTV